MDADDDLKRRVREQYEQIAPQYEQRWATYVRGSVRETLRRLEVGSGECLLDVGCGPGTLLEALLKAGARTRAVGIDLARAMIQLARRRLPSSVILVVGDAEALPFATATFDVVVSSSAFHYWPAPQRSLAELRRVLRPAGRLVLTDWCDDYLASRLCARVLRWVDPAHERIYGADDCSRLLEQAGFRVTRLDRYRLNWLWGLMTAMAVAPEATAS